ncbi:hypothetical protein B0H10DRAFT_2194328 [Mycena sp. CBHHK59/15]|nr:hypothetical protein B0H10DRAFT_2194328 [Mycena sp. CBHHK59/15]
MNKKFGHWGEKVGGEKSDFLDGLQVCIGPRECQGATEIPYGQDMSYNQLPTLPAPVLPSEISSQSPPPIASSSTGQKRPRREVDEANIICTSRVRTKSAKQKSTESSAAPGCGRSGPRRPSTSHGRWFSWAQNRALPPTLDASSHMRSFHGFFYRRRLQSVQIVPDQPDYIGQDVLSPRHVFFLSSSPKVRTTHWACPTQMVPYRCFLLCVLDPLSPTYDLAYTVDCFEDDECIVVGEALLTTANQSSSQHSSPRRTLARLAYSDADDADQDPDYLEALKRSMTDTGAVLPDTGPVAGPSGSRPSRALVSLQCHSSLPVTCQRTSELTPPHPDHLPKKKHGGQWSQSIPTVLNTLISPTEIPKV